MTAHLVDAPGERASIDVDNDARSPAARMSELVRDGVSRLDLRLRARALAAVVTHACAHLGDELTSARGLVALANVADAAAAAIRDVDAEGVALMVAYQAAESPEAKRAVLVRHLEARGGPRHALRADVRATKRWLDLEAMQERFAADIADRIDEIEIAYQAMATHVDRSDRPEILTAMKSGGVIAIARSHAKDDQRPAVRTAALRFLVRCVVRAPVEGRLGLLGASLAREVQRYARGDGVTRWTQVAAIELVANCFPDDAHLLLGSLLASRKGADGMVIRRNALRLVASIATRKQHETAMIAHDDPSEHVRQELARTLSALETERSLATLGELVQADASPRVAGVALRELAIAAVHAPSARPAAEQAIEHALANVSRTLPVRVAFEAIRRLSVGPVAVLPPARFVPRLELLANDAGTPAALTDEAASLLRWLEVEADGTRRALRNTFRAAIEPLLEGESAEVDLPEGIDPLDAQRALAVASRGDMAVALRMRGARSAVVTRGEPRSWRFWRFLQEARTPMPDKRKGYVHTHGRDFAGETVIAPAGMAEVTPTRVPGERQLHPALGGWGPFLPRVDDLLAAAAVVPRTLRIVSPLGTVLVVPPMSWRARLRARFVLSVRYVAYATARERALTATEPAERTAYARMAAALGFRFSLAEEDGAVGGARFSIRAALPRRYLDGALNAAVPPGAIEAAIAYFLSPSGGTPTQLGLVAWVVLATMVVRAAAIMRGIERARRAVPLTIGGWGTRGKSGSERLKAALFHALRYDVVVKTTGCEAMFIHALRDLPAQEIFIYRPYDKATIWEQRNVLHVARELDAQVFLWECMALQPRFVDTLANEWMQDDVTTLTNAYPDHEDIQGPGGEDVARVIGRFMPVSGHTYTTEEQMLPLLADAARRKKTKLHVVAPIEADLLPIDLLDRLPYQEHPRNVAMVLALAEHYGIDRELALVEIADHVIADLGVLKTYPTVEHRGRKLTFSNGMSANERAGFLSNWIRLGFDKNDVDAEPDVTVCAVVNNRADRVARSRVFAQIFVDDAPCDHIVLINTNLAGMMQFIEEALDKKLEEMRVTGEGCAERALARFDDAMRVVKVPASDDALRVRVRRMLDALPLAQDRVDAILATPDVDAAVCELSADLGSILEAALASVETSAREDRRPDVVRHAARLATRMRMRRQARADIAAALARGAEAEANEVFRKTYRTLFLDRIAVLWDAGATGDQVVDFVAREVPPGQNVRIMGTQNIKGTGLDFVYRWLSIDRVRGNLARLDSQPHLRGELLAFFGSYGDFGLLDCREALDRLRAVDARSTPEWSEHEVLLASVVARLSDVEKEKAARLVSSGKTSAVVRASNRIEAFFDHLDSIRRTRTASRVMADLYARRVSHGRAAILLRDVTARSKGGWLAKDLAKWWSSLRSRGG